ncbi:MFS transporter [Candidatus Accumulibacter sp. ACC003]|uniref:MFS transporter n=1 Tax=Candidatus Accumulibacter sp. ACC003 TaxID=2823334 RepID=UPI0025BA79A1|nr:MFS transporter [Candidatus Accumulibacter sp. ACC003]
MSATRLSGAMRRNILLLALSQAAVMTSISLVLASSVVIGVSLATPALATLPLAMQYLGTMLVLYPMARLIARYGQRPVFIGGALIGALGLALAAVGIWLESFVLFALAGGLVGVFNAVGQYYRFAAAEAVPADLRSKAISLTLSGGVLAALAGPNLARWTRDMLVQPFAASFLALVGVALLAAVLATGLRLRQPMSSVARVTPPFLPLLRRPDFLLAVVSGVVAYALMNLLMTATPLAMMCNQLGFSETATVIQWHVVAMFAPSFFTGSLIQRFGVLPVMLLGGLSMLGGIVVAVNGETLAHFVLALLLLGIGWNFLYVGATTRLVECCPPEQKAQVQAFNDSLVFLAIAGVTFSAGGLVDRYGWMMLNLYAAIPVLLLMVAIAWQWQVGRRALQPASA